VQTLPKTRKSPKRTLGRRASRRAGLVMLDYVLILAVILPMVAIIFRLCKTLLPLVYEMVCALISWPFM
jgi:hypothetical protein